MKKWANRLRAGSRPALASLILPAVSALWLAAATDCPGAIQGWDPNGSVSIGGGGVWDTSTKNWTPAGTQTQVASASLVAWTAGNVALFCAGPSSGSSQGTFSMTVNGAVSCGGIDNGIDNPGSCIITVNNGTSGSISLPSATCPFRSAGTVCGTTTINVPITGVGPLQTFGCGGITFGVANSFTGGFQIDATGGVSFGHSAIWGTGPITWQTGGFIQPVGTTAYNVTNSMTHLAGSIETYAGNTGGVTFSGPWTLGASGTTVTLNNIANTITVSGAISGAGALATKITSPGVGWTLTGANSYTGATTNTSGTLTIGGAGKLGSGTYAGAINNSASFVYNSSAAQTLGGVISGTGSLTQQGSGPLTLSGANIFTGGTTISGGVLSVNTIADSGTSALGNSGTLTLSGGTLSYTGSGAASTTRTFSGTSGTTSTIDIPSGNLTNSVLTSGGAFTVNKTGAGTLTLIGSADNSFLALNITAGTVVLAKTSSGSVHGIGGGTTVSNATLVLAGSGGDQVFNSAGITVQSNGVFNLNGQSETVASLSLSGTGISSGGALVNNNGSTTSTLTGGVTLASDSSIGGSANVTLASALGGSHSVTKVGNGNLQLNAAANYTGTTTVNAGNLALGANNVLPSGTTVNLNGGNLNMVTFNNTVGALQFAGAGKAKGTWGSTTSTANHKSTLFSGTGILTVTTGGSSTTSVGSSLNPSAQGDLVTFTAMVNGSGGGGATPSGTVTFLDGGTPIGSGTLSGGGSTATASFGTSTLSVGTHLITASYGGDPNYDVSTSTVLSQTVNSPLTVTCSTDITVTATSLSGAVVTYPPATTGGGCGGASANCNPPSGSTFPIGTNTVTCQASDSCANSAQCTFTIIVNPLPSVSGPEYFFGQPVLPPIGSVYISPAQWHVLYNDGIVIRDVRHRFFTQNYPLPPLGSSQPETFSSELDFDLSTDNGATFTPASGTANVTVQVTHSQDVGGTSFFDTEMLQLDMMIPGGPTGTILLRESPTLQSTGQTTVRPVSGGYMVSSFFDVFTEVSLDNGNTWTPGQQSGHVEMHPDPKQVTPTPAPTPLLPPPGGAYVSPQQWHALYAQGIVIRNVSHRLFTGSLQPPAPGVTNIHNFNSQIDVDVSSDGGATYQTVRVAAPVQVTVASHGSSTDTIYDTEMTALSLNLPNGIMIRESPTEPSRGQVEIDAQPDGTYRISSFFDIFTELSLDGGASWAPATNGPVRVELVPVAPEAPQTNPNLPPPNGSYVSPAEWHALYANGIILTNVSHSKFTQTQPPPPPGGNQTESFSSQVSGLISQDGGATFQPFSAPANVGVQVNSRADEDNGSTRFFDTEMLQLDISGGSLPGGVMVRESPTLSSLGRTSVRTDGTGYQISSFFDIFTEVSLDGGATWTPSVTAPGTMGLSSNTPSQFPIFLTCPADMTVTASGPSGATVFYTPSASGGCGVLNIVGTPASGSTFAVGTNVVTVTASDGCGDSAMCSFNVIVNPQPAVVGPEYFFTQPVLPPVGSVYISPAQWHVLYNNGIVIRDVRHRFFTQNYPLPPLGSSQPETFSSELDFELSLDNGATFAPASGTANVTVQVTHSSDANDSSGTEFFSTEMVQLDLTIPGGPTGTILLRESPTLQSTGQTTVRPVSGGYMVSSFFDVFTEVSVDNGGTWTPGQQSGHVEMHPDPKQATPAPAPTPLLPPPGGAYVSPQQWHALYAQGIVIRNVSHRLFTGSLQPPGPGVTDLESFNSQIDLDVSTDGGNTYQTVRVAAPVQVSVASHGSSGDTIYDTKMTSLSLSGLPGGIMIRESPTLPSRGEAEVDAQPDGTYQISSFFDIFTELSLDGGNTWSPATNGPVRVELVPVAPEAPQTSPSLPPPNGSYVSPAQWHALYANGIIITNASHDRFTQTQPPPSPGTSQTESFGSQVSGLISMNGGASFQPFSAPASVSVQVNSRSDEDNGSTRFFDTEMLQLDLSGGSLPGGIMVRESPTLSSLGRTSVRTDGTGGYQISSFFDIFTEVSLDGGNTWSPTVTAPGTMGLSTNTPGATLSITCPSNITVTATGPSGAQVFYTVTASGGSCPPVSVVVNPPSGSTFPIGTNTVMAVASDSCGDSASCTFNVIVQPQATVTGPEYFFTQPVLPPVGSVYISPAQWHVLYNNGIVIRDVRHRFFTQNYPLPPLGSGQPETFSSELDFELSLDNGATFTPASGTASVTVQVTHTQDVGGTSFFDTEMLQLDMMIPGGPTGTIMLRESPTLPSTGQATVRPVSGGYMVSSFFDVFTEVSLDNGNTWTPAQQSGHVEMHPDPKQVTPTPAPTPLLPPPGGAYVSPQQWHALYAQGIVIRNVSHRLFTGALQPPGPGVTNVHNFNSQLDLDVSTDGGNTYQTVRVAAPVQVTVASHGSSTDTIYDTEMTSLSLSGLPGGIMIRESPTEPSRGQVEIDAQPDGTYRISSFFHIFTELSLDGGASWSPATNGPVRVELVPVAPEAPQTNPNLPPPNGSYVSPAQWHALYANGIIITNVSHNRFTQTQPPPSPGTSQMESFGSQVSGLISMDGGASFQPFSAPASVSVQVDSRSDLDNGSTRYFDTEMLQLDLSGGNLAGGVMVRESPSKASLGRTSVRTDNSTGGYQISSFFDIFTEVSLDGGNTWSPSITAPGTMGLGTNAPAETVSITCPSNITAQATGPAGAVVFFTVTAGGGCTPPNIVANPPSGSTFPIGTTTVTATASDTCGNSAMCSFTVTVSSPAISIACPSNIVVQATGGGGANVFFNVNATGGCSPPPFVTANPPSGSMFPIGTTTVFATASDTCGGSTNCSFTATVYSPLSVNCPTNITAQATGPAGAVVFFTATASGGCSPPNLVANPPSGSTFPIGTTTVTATASDTCGNSAMCSFTVTVYPPVSIACSSNIVVQATGGGGANVFFNVNATGGCSPPPIVTANPPSGSMFPIGTTTVFATASDTCGGSTNCSFTVTVYSPLSVNCPTNITAQATGPAGAVVFFTATASGGCTPPNIVANPPSGSTFPIGTTTVTATASDTCGNSAMCSFTVTVYPPLSIACPSNIVVEATGGGGANVFFTVNASGGCSPPPFVTANPPSGSTFPIGTTTVFATASDTCGNSTNCSFTVTVSSPAISIACPSNIVVQATGGSGANVFFNVNATGGCSPPPFVTANPPSGSTFPIGTTTVFATASDTCGGSTNCSFTVTVYSPLSVNCPTNITAQATGPAGAVVFFTATASGGCSPPNLVANPPSGSTFPVGTTPVLVTASDDCGNSTNCSFLVTVYSPLSIACPSNIVVQATGGAGASVFFTVNASGGCSPPPFVTANPASGSTFPVGTTTVFATASDTCGNSTNCSFTVTVYQSTVAPEYFSTTTGLPATNTVYISPALWHTLYAQGIVIRDIRHRYFTQGFPPPPLGTSQTHSFSSEVDCEISTDGGTTFQPASGTAAVTVSVTHSQDSTGTSLFDTEMLQLDATLPGGPSGSILLRESPTLQSIGQTSVRPVSGGYMVSSFFDIFTEISLDNGQTWLPAQDSAHVEMRTDPRQVSPATEPTPLLPTPNDAYVSPAQWHALYAQGIVIRDVRHKLFTQALQPPPPGGTNFESFNSILDLQVSTDGGNTFQAVRVPAPVQVQVSSLGSGASGMFDAQMTSLNATVQAGSMNLMLRASQVEPSRGGTQIDAQPDGTYRISSFFDIFTELSLDGGQTWAAPTNGPVRMQLTPEATEVPSLTQSLPLTNSPYVSPAQWHAAYANGIYVSNVTHRGFTQSYPPPTASKTSTETFGSMVDLQISMDGGHTFTSASVPMTSSVKVTSRSDMSSGPTQVYDTEMLSLDLSGGSLPGGIMVRESPSKASLGRTTVRPDPSSGGYRISSFFDIFTEVSVDGGQTWLASTSPPALMTPRLPASKRYFAQPYVPPTNGQYISPAAWHAAYANGVIISNVTHKRFLANFPPPAPWSTNTHNFGSQVNLLLSMGPGQQFMPVTANADCTVSVGSSGFQSLEQVYQTEMVSLNVSGGSLPAGVMIRESPSKASTGETRFTGSTGGYRISSFFDIFTEVSLDGGQTWSPASSPGYMELHIDPGVPPTTLMSPTLQGGKLSVSLQSQNGLQYILQYKNDLREPTWTSLSGITPGNGQLITISDPTAVGVSQRFYRVAVQEAPAQ